MRKRTNINLISCALVAILITILGACATTGQSQYKAYITSEKEFSGLAEQYQMWYEAANDETKLRLKETMDPLFRDVDILLDDYHDIMLNGGDATDVALQLRRIKTRILMELAKKNQ